MKRGLADDVEARRDFRRTLSNIKKSEQLRLADAEARCHESQKLQESWNSKQVRVGQMVDLNPLRSKVTATGQIRAPMPNAWSMTGVQRLAFCSPNAVRCILASSAQLCASALVALAASHHRRGALWTWMKRLPHTSTPWAYFGRCHDATPIKASGLWEVHHVPS